MTFAWCLPVQTNLPGIFIPGARWGASVIRFGVGGMYQVMRTVGLEPGALNLTLCTAVYLAAL